VLEGEPPDDEARAIADEIYEHHQGYGLPLDRPAPLLLQSGWTDDLFPARESLRLYNALRARKGKADVALQFGDLGHSRGANEEETNQPLNDQGADFFDKLLRGEGSRPNKGSVTAFAQTCPSDDQESDGPFKAGSWHKIHPRTIGFSSSTTQTAISNPPDPLGIEYDPITGTSDSCKPSEDDAAKDAGTAVYKGEPSQGFRMIGLPTVTADISVTGPEPDDAQLDARLWDVDENGSQILISRGAYRIGTDADGEVTFQLWGNAWCFAPGHTPKLQLLGTDRPYLRPTTTTGPGSNAVYSVAVESLEVKLPAQRGRCGD
jgi:predicted acyl esterase